MHAQAFHVEQVQYSAPVFISRALSSINGELGDLRAAGRSTWNKPLREIHSLLPSVLYFPGKWRATPIASSLRSTWNDPGLRMSEFAKIIEMEDRDSSTWNIPRSRVGECAPEKRNMPAESSTWNNAAVDQCREPRIVSRGTMLVIALKCSTWNVPRKFHRGRCST